MTFPVKSQIPLSAVEHLLGARSCSRPFYLSLHSQQPWKASIIIFADGAKALEWM
jgi:hypothetical protein